MALKTQGFALSSMPRAPSIPANVGAVDVKEIYDGVRQGLAAFENVRRAPASMLLADAEMKAKTAEAPLGTRQVLAQTEGIEAQTPLKTAILAAEASPEMQDAKRQALLNRSAKQPAGDVQLATALAGARQRLVEDPTDAHAAQLVAALEPIVLNKSAASAKNPQGAIEAANQRTTDTNLARTDIADLNRNAANQRTTDTLATREALAKQGFSQSEINARIAADSRVQAARAQFTGKIYETAAQKNEKVNEELLALKVLDQKVKQYVESGMGAGPIAGSGPMVTARAIFGDTTGKELAAATALSMRSAVETMRGLGAMSEKEFNAAMSQLPLTSDTPEALNTKMDYLNIVRPWIAARNAMFLDRIEAGDSPIQAHAAVRRALPLTGPDGNVVDPQGGAASAQSAPPPVAAFATAEEADAAGAAGTIQSGAKITVGGKPATWVAP